MSADDKTVVQVVSYAHSAVEARIGTNYYTRLSGIKDPKVQMTGRKYAVKLELVETSCRRTLNSITVLDLTRCGDRSGGKTVQCLVVVLFDDAWTRRRELLSAVCEDV